MAIPVKVTRAHQVTLPKRLLNEAGWEGQEYFLADLHGGSLVLTPMTLDAARPLASFDDLRRHFARIGVTRRDATAAVRWARRQAGDVSRRRRTAR